MRILELFSGIGGFSYAAQQVWGSQLEVAAYCEKDEFCQKVIRKNIERGYLPDAPIHDDIRTLDYEKIMAYAECNREKRNKSENRKRCDVKQECKVVKNRNGNTRQHDRQRYSYKNKSSTTINLLTGGFPCQPFSVAGKRRGKADDRAIWPQMYRVIKEVRPAWVIAENVAGIINMELDGCLSDLEAAGYEAWTFVIPACAVDAPHRRDRVWIVGNAGCVRQAQHEKQATGIEQHGQDAADASQKLLNGSRNTRPAGGDEHTNSGSSRLGKRKQTIRGVSNWLPEPELGRVAHGIPNRVDRLKSLGNAIAPQCVMPIMECIKAIEDK